jgi:hypothetical protein
MELLGLSAEISKGHLRLYMIVSAIQASSYPGSVCMSGGSGASSGSEFTETEDCLSVINEINAGAPRGQHRMIRYCYGKEEFPDDHLWP